MKRYLIHDHDGALRVAAFLSSLQITVPIDITITKHAKRRSVSANNRYWAILTQIADQVADDNGTKYSPETWHSFFKATFLGKDTILVDGVPVLLNRESHTLSTMEFSDYMTQVEAWGVEHDVRFIAYKYGLAET